MPTEKQKKLVTKIVENSGNKPLGTLMKEVGYSEASAKNPQNFINAEGVKEASKDVVTRMIEARDRALAALEVAEQDAKYGDFVQGVDKLTKNVELLTGGVTERVGYEWDDYDEDINEDS